MDKSIVPLGTGVTIKTGLKKDLGLLLDANQATYSINSGPDWHLLYIRATKAELNGGWAFSLESFRASDVGLIYQKDSPSYDPPRLVDQNLYPIAKTWGWQDVYRPGVQYQELPPGAEPEVLTTGPLLSAYGFVTNLALSYFNRHSMHNMVEVGTHIYPIAYHRIVPGTPETGPVAQVVQVARSDWHFWPLPNLPIWSKQPQLLNMYLDTTTTPPPPE